MPLVGGASGQKEDVELTDKASNSFATNLPSRYIDRKKYIKISETIEKKILPEIRGWTPEHKKRNITSLYICEEEKFSDLSGENKIKKKKNLQVQLHRKTTEIEFPSLKLSTEKRTKKENSMYKLPNQYSICKTSLPLHTSSSILRKKEVLSNLYLTLYDNVSQGYLYSQEINALHRACRIFSKIRNGRIYVNDLPTVLRILKISVSDSEMRQALKAVDIDVNGILDFSNFLKTLNEVSYLVSQDPAFQDALNTFNRIKHGRVVTDEVIDVLDSMDIPINHETLQEVLKCSYIDSNHMVDIGNIVFVLNDLHQQYEDVSIMDGSTLDETASKRKLPSVAERYLKHKRKRSLPSKLSESSGSKKLNKTPLQHHSKLMGENDGFEFKRAKNIWQGKKFLGGIDSSNTGFQEPYPLNVINLQKHSEKAEFPDSKVTPQSLKSITSLNKSLGKSDISSIPKLQNPALRKHLNLLKQVSSKDKAAVNTPVLENVCEAISEFRDYIAAEELQSTLPSTGIPTLDEEFQKNLAKTRDESGMVKLDDSLSTVSKEQSLLEYDALTDVIKAIDKIKDGRVGYADLNNCLQNFGVYLSKPELEKIGELTEIDDTKTVNFKEFVDTMLNNTDRFSEKLLLHNVIEDFHNLSKEKMSVSDLWNTLTSLNSNLKKDEFLAALKLVKVDEDNKVQFDEFAEAVKNVNDASRLEESREIVLALDSLGGDVIAEKNLGDFLRSVGIKLPQEEVQKILQSDFVSQDNMVNIRDFIQALRNTQKFSNFTALNETINKLDCMKSSESDKDKYSYVLEDTDRSYFTDDTLQKRVDDFFDKDLFKEIMVLNNIRNDKMPVNELSSKLLSAGIPLSNKMFQEILRQASIDENSEVSLKEILENLSKNKPAPILEGINTALKNVNLINDDRIPVNDLKDAFEDLNISLKPEEHQMLEKTLDVDEKGYISLKTALLALKNNKRLEDFREVNELAKALDKVNSEKIDFDEVKSTLKGLGICFPEEELQVVLSSISVDKEGKVDLKDCLSRLVQAPYFTKDSSGEVSFYDLENIQNIGIEFTSEEHLEPEKLLPLKGLQIDAHDLDNLLGNVALKLTAEELNALTPNLSIHGEEIDVSDVKTVLDNMGIEQTHKGSLEPMNILPVDAANAEVYQKKLMDGVKSPKGGIIDVSKLDTILQNMEMKLTETEVSDLKQNMPIDEGISDINEVDILLKRMRMNLAEKETSDLIHNLPVDGLVDVTELGSVLQNMGMKLSEMESKDLIEKLPVDVNEKIKTTKLMDAMKAFTGKKVDANDLPNVLGSMGIELTEGECAELQEAIPTDAAGKMYQKRLLDGVKSMKGGMVKINNLDNVLKNLGIELTEKEHESLTENLSLSASGTTDLSKLLEAVEIVTGGEIDTENALEEMGIALTEKEHEELITNLSVDDNGKVFKNRLLDGLKSFNGGFINVNKLDSVVKNMGCKLSEEEIKDLKCNLPTNVDGKVAMSELFDELKAFTGKEIDVQDLSDFLSNMGIELTDKEQIKLLNELPVDASGKIYENRLLNGVKSFKGGKVQKSKMDSVLENLGIKLTEKELEHLAAKLPVNDAGNINFSELMEEVKIITGGEASIREIKSVLGSMGVELTEKEDSELAKMLPVDADGKFYQNRLMNSVKSLKGEKIDINKLDTLLENMGMKVSEKELKDIAENLPVDVDGKVKIKKLLNTMNVFSDENKIDINDLKNTLGSVGSELTEEFLNLQQTVPVDGGKVNVNSIDIALQNVGIKLTESELKDLAENLTVDANGKVNLHKLIDGVKALTGGVIDISDVENILGNMGIDLTEKERLKLLKNLPADADGKIYQNRLMSGLKSLKGGTIDVNKLHTVLGNMGMRLTEKELKDLTQKLSVDGDGKVNLKSMMDEVKNFSGKKVHICDLQSLLKNMGIELTDTECLELKKTLPTDAAGEVFQNRILDGVKSLKGGMVNINDLNKVLGNMGIKLTVKELEDLTKNLPVNANGKTVLSKLIDEVQAVTGEDVDIDDVKDVVENMGIELTEKECMELVEKLSAYADRKIFQNRLLEGLKALKGGKIDVNKLDTVLGNMGMSLTDKELEELTQGLPVNVDGKVDMKKVMNKAKTFTGEKIDINNLEKALENMGIKLSERELTKLKITLPVSDDGKVRQNRVLKGVKSLKRGKVDINNLGPLLENMDIKLTEKELIQLRDGLPIEADGRVDLNKIMDRIKAITGGKVDVNDVKSVLENMGIELKDEEFLELLKNLPLDDDEKIFQNRLLESVKSLKSGNVSVNNLKPILDNMGIKLKDNELKDLTQNLPVGVDKKISLETLMNKLKIFTGEKVDSSGLKSTLRDLGIELTDKEQEKLLETLSTDASGKIYQKRLLKALKSLEGGKVHVNNLDNTLERLGIELTEKELTKLSENLQVDVTGKTDLKEVMDRVKATTGGEIDARDVKTVLSNMGIEFTDEEHLQLVKNLPVNDENKIFKSRLLEAVKSLKGGKVNVNNLDTILDNLGIKLSNTELKDLTQNMQVDVDKKIPLEALMEKVKDFTGKKIDSSDIRNVLGNLSIELTEKELEKLLKTLPVNDAGKVYYNRLLKSIKSLKEGKIKKNNLHSTLKSIGIKLTEEELAELSKNLHADENENVELHDVMKEIKAITGKVDIKNLETILGNMGVKLTKQELESLTQSLPVSADKKVALKTLENEVKAFIGEKIDSDDIQNILKNMGIELTDKEQKHLLKALPIDANGKVFRNKLLKEVKNNKGGKVNVNYLDAILDNMNIKITEKELQKIKDLLRDADKKVDLKKLMDKVEAVIGEEIDVSDVETVLTNMGIELPEKKLSYLINNLPVDDGKVYQKRLLDGIKHLKGGKIDSSKVNTVLENMGINLTETELKDLAKNLAVDGNGKINLENVMNEMRPFTGDKIDTNKLTSVLENMGIELTPDEHLNLLKTLPVDANGKVYQKRLMKAIKSLKRGNIDVDKLDTLLENMGIKTTEKEFMDLTERLPNDAKGKVKLSELMKELHAVLGNQVDVRDLENALKDLLVEVTDEEYSHLLKSLPLDAEGKLYKKTLLDSLKALKRGKVDMNNLNSFLDNMGLNLSQKELEDFLQNLPVDVDGKAHLKNVTQRMKDFTGEKINAGDLKNVLKNMGIEVSDKECAELLALLPVDDDNKVFQNRLLTGLKSFKGGRVDVNKLKNILRNMGIKLKNKELKNIIRNQFIDANGYISLKKVIDDVEAVTASGITDLHKLLEEVKEFTGEQDILCKRVKVKCKYFAFTYIF
nr:EF-hand calcium-binding domain-containing protein 13 isoform X25 [Oryctolagus cuniculus]XP_051681033.1 EF-hand calcium-binding domain-containing protein 13 isoform X26 [Oryctolagus cuniculus]